VHAGSGSMYSMLCRLQFTSAVKGGAKLRGWLLECMQCCGGDKHCTVCVSAWFLSMRGVLQRASNSANQRCAHLRGVCCCWLHSSDQCTPNTCCRCACAAQCCTGTQHLHCHACGSTVLYQLLGCAWSRLYAYICLDQGCCWVLLVRA
jgi:hypothetical protein